MDAKSFQALPKTKIRFIEPMYALSVQKLPEGKEWLYEVKFDGYRHSRDRRFAPARFAPRRRNPGARCLRFPLDKDVASLTQEFG